MKKTADVESAPRAVALIPARSGSSRIPNKNIKPLGGHPLIAYAIASAKASGVFQDVIVSTDSDAYADVARHYGASLPFLRPVELAGPLTPDFAWVSDTLERLRSGGRSFDCFSILRPTNPFRHASTIRRAWNTFTASPEADSLRAVEKCGQHPGKMWRIEHSRLVPIMEGTAAGQPWHSSPYQALPDIFAQNGSLEIAWSRVVFEGGTIAGNVVVPFVTEGLEGFDLNRPEDWERAESLVAARPDILPDVPAQPYQKA